MTEQETRNKMARIAIRMRQMRQRRQRLDAEWQELVAERIELQDQLDCYEEEKAHAAAT